MSYQLTTAAGSIEAIIDDNCGMKKFFSIAEALVREFKVKFSTKEDNSDSVHWHFNHRGHKLILHYSIYNGVSISNNNSKDNKAVSELATFLENKYY